ncbi:FMN reductase [Spinactinospora alkalitolerans]|uniref:FMN reductase n=1 Tax=Spinactinospora alkalitolerans TaxID=687207 RepID=A0A852U173_9ACTN|nr:NAD(P)H-dependent oxidoreductase [Spinactinospora alkalitolerans]NYE47924.1 FMN reductase [Spinactinospora alkalitolerans]
MRVLAIIGSPKSGGRSSVGARAVLEGAQAAGAEVGLVELAGADASDGEPDRVIDAVDGADGIVFAAPVYRARAAHSLKTFLDGLPRGMWGETTAPLQGKACALVLTGASWHHFLALDDLRGVLAGFFAAQVLSPGLYLPNDAFVDRERLTAASADLAAAHGAALVDLARAVRESKALAALRPLA